MKPPKVFASYSHDSDEHKKWVLKFCTKLRQNGVDVSFDQWDLAAGDDIPLFMENAVKGSDRVLVVCTDIYVRKANAGVGGVGYERLIVTAQLTQNLGTNKFIPIIRQSSTDEKTPTFLATRKHIDFTDDHTFDEKFEELLHEIQDVPIIRKPPLGKSSIPGPSTELKVPDSNLLGPSEQIESASAAHEAARKLVRSHNIPGWSQLVKRIRPDVFGSLVLWRQQELDKQIAEDQEKLLQIIDKAVDIVSPLISMALVGIESCDNDFNDQGSLLDDLVNIQNMEDWNLSGYRPWIEIPYALGYVYHSLHGGLCLQTNRLDLAFSLAQAKFPVSIEEPQLIKSLWQNDRLMGYCEPLGKSDRESWQYLANAFERWKWLSLVFKDDLNYRISLVAYYMVLSIHKLAADINSGRELKRSGSVPTYFVNEEYEIKQRAPSLLVKNSVLSNLWTSLNITKGQMESAWETWIELHIPRSSTKNPPEFVNFFDAV